MISPVASRSERARTSVLNITLPRHCYTVSSVAAALLAALIWRERTQ